MQLSFLKISFKFLKKLLLVQTNLNPGRWKPGNLLNLKKMAAQTT